MDEETTSSRCRWTSNMLRTRRRRKPIEPALRHVRHTAIHQGWQSHQPSVYTSAKRTRTHTRNDHLHSTLLQVPQFHIRSILSHAQRTRKHLHRPVSNFDKKNPVVQPVPFLRHHQIHMPKSVSWTQEHTQGFLRVHEHYIAIVPHRPVQALVGGFRDLSPEDREQEAVFCP